MTIRLYMCSDHGQQTCYKRYSPSKILISRIFYINGLIESYQLNGLEIERAVRQILGPDCCMIWGDFRGVGNDGRALAPANGNLADRVRALIERIQLRYWARPDWTGVNRCIEKDEEDVDQYYHRLQQLKNDKGTTVYVLEGGTGRDRGRGRRRGRDTGRGTGRDRGGYTEGRTEACYTYGKMGHWAIVIKENRTSHQEMKKHV